MARAQEPEAGSDVAASDSPSFRAGERPALRVGRTAGSIEIDGELDDPGWEGAARATGFTEIQPDEGAEPPVRTEVWMAYDEGHLYLGFLAHDDPRTVRASLTDRDEMFSDDFVGIMLDTYDNAAWAYELFVNPLGVQADLRRSSGDVEDAGFDIVFHSDGRVTGAGYQVEMAIPFASLRFPGRAAQSWRATFLRNRPRGSRAQYSWAAIDLNDPCVLCQLGTLTGIEDVEPGGALELLPGAVASRSGSLSDPSDPGSPFESGDLEAELSLGARYAFSAGVTAEATLNPDFSQVESDPGLVDVNTTFALSFPERRPFFQEGAELFETDIDAVYTRSINAPQAAAKLIARQGRTSVAYLGARDESSPILLPFEERSFLAQGGKSVSNLLRARQRFGEDNSAGVLVTDRRLEGGAGSNTVFGGDADVRFLGNYRADFQLLASHSREPDAAGVTEPLAGATFDRGAHTSAFDGESFGGYAQHTGLHREARTWNFDLVYRALSPTFRSDNGFVTRNDSRRLYMRQRLLFYPDVSFIDRIQPRFYVERRWNFAGVRKEEFAVPELAMMLKGQTQVDIQYHLANERFRDTDFRGLRRLDFFVDSEFSEPVSAGVFVSTGEFIARNLETPRRGEGTEVELFLDLKPLQRLLIEPSVRYSELHDPEDGSEFFEGSIFRTRTSLQFSRELFFRLVVQYDEFGDRLDVEPLITYRLNPFTLFYAGSSMGYRDFGGVGGSPGAMETGEPGAGFTQTSRQFFAKFQYLLQF